MQIRCYPLIHSCQPYATLLQKKSARLWVNVRSSHKPRHTTSTEEKT
nr:MAG TPA: hypothetical protein [Caudoviricetes sp.]